MAVIAGCGSSYQQETARVSGRVTLDGEPVTSGYVVALPKVGRTARAVIQPDGSFVFGTYSKTDGVKVGTHPVTVSPLPPHERSQASRDGPQIPKKYTRARTSGLKITVEPGGADDFLVELTSDE